MGTLRRMESDRRVVLPRLASLVLAAGFAPLIASWGLGARGWILDLLATPAALLAGIPAALGPLSAGVVALLVLMGPRDPRAAQAGRLLGAIAGLGLLAAAAAGSRPLPWIAAIFVARALLAPPSRRAAPAWTIPPALGRWAPPVLWLLATRVRPFGDGLLTAGVEDGIAAALTSAPNLGEAALVVGLGGLGAVLHRMHRASVLGAVVGGGLAVLLTATFGNDQASVSAAALGALIGAWPPRSRGDLVDGLAPVLLVCLLAATRLGVTERWRCDDLASEPHARLLRAGGDVRGIALAPGNLPWIVALVEDGAGLQRLTVTGAAGASVPLDPPGGLLVSPLRPGQPVARVVHDGGLQIEWWDISRMQATATRRLAIDCVPARALHWDDDTIEVACRGGRGWRVGPAGDPLAADVSNERLRGGTLSITRGARARVRIQDLDGARVADSAAGPWAASVSTAPGRFAIARGPAGHLELRGLPIPVPTLPSPPPEGPARTRAMLDYRIDSVRVGTWPSQSAYVVPQKALYVWSELDPFVTLVDPAVTWHQSVASIGAPPRQVVVDPGSGTLYGGNRCGVFAVRVPTTFPWE